MKWFRFYSEFRSDPKMRRMPIAHRYAFIVLLCLANESATRGTITGLDDDDIAYELEMDTEDWLTLKAKFKVKGLIYFEGQQITITNWEKRQFASDSSAERVARHRDKKKKQGCNVTETLGNGVETLVKRRVTPPDPDPDPDIRSDQEDLDHDRDLGSYDQAFGGDSNESQMCTIAGEHKFDQVFRYLDQGEVEAPDTNPEFTPGLSENPKTKEGINVPPSPNDSKKTTKEIKLKWFNEVFVPNYPYRLKESGDRVRNIGKVQADPHQYLRYLSIEAIESGQATDGLRAMIQAGCREYRAKFHREPEMITPKGTSYRIYVLPFIPDPVRWFRDRCWKNEYDLGEPVAPNMPWGEEPNPGFLAYLCKFYLPAVPSYQTSTVTVWMAKSWLNAAKHNQKRFEDACFQWGAFQEHLQRQELSERVIATAETVEQFTSTREEPFEAADLLTRLKGQYKIPSLRGEALRRAREAGIDIALLEESA